jgi:hypothetical protein
MTEELGGFATMGQRPRHSINHFSISNPAGLGQGDVPKLLRSLADSLEQEGDVQVMDIVFHSEVTGEEDDLTFTVYFDSRPRRR